MIDINIYDSQHNINFCEKCGRPFGKNLRAIGKCVKCHEIICLECGKIFSKADRKITLCINCFPRIPPEKEDNLFDIIMNGVFKIGDTVVKDYYKGAELITKELLEWDKKKKKS